MQNTLWPEIHKLYGHGYEVREMLPVSCLWRGRAAVFPVECSRYLHMSLSVMLQNIQVYAVASNPRGTVLASSCKVIILNDCSFLFLFECVLDSWYSLLLVLSLAPWHTAHLLVLSSSIAGESSGTCKDFVLVDERLVTARWSMFLNLNLVINASSICCLGWRSSLA